MNVWPKSLVQVSEPLVLHGEPSGELSHGDLKTLSDLLPSNECYEIRVCDSSRSLDHSLLTLVVFAFVLGAQLSIPLALTLVGNWRYIIR